MKRRHFLLVVFLLLLLGGICACKSNEPEKTVILSADYPQYDSVGGIGGSSGFDYSGKCESNAIPTN